MLEHWIWFATRQGLNKRTRYELLQRFRDPEEIHRASKETLQAAVKLTPRGLAELEDPSLDQAREILNRCRQREISLLTMHDGGYPQRLLGICDPPVVLYCRGRVPDWDAQPMIGAVGTRGCSPYGIRSAEQLGYQLTRCGGCVVSGMAEGIDTAVLRGALAAEGTPVIVLAGGADVIYPTQNRELYRNIQSRGGCIVSEQPPGVKPTRWLFPARNRIISGISHGVLVVEAPERSGALITARHAMEQGRPVYAVPGPIGTATCQGSNGLLKAGAHMVQSGWDILEPYAGLYEGVRNRIADTVTAETDGGGSTVRGKKSAQSRPKEKKVIDNGIQPPYSDVEKKPAVRSPQEQAIVNTLLSGPRLTDAVIHGCGLPRGEALAVMTMLEIRGVLRRLPGNLIAMNETEME